MKLNAFNVYMKDNRIQCDQYGRPMGFYPIKWQIDWSFNSGAEDPDHADYYSTSALLKYALYHVGKTLPDWVHGILFQQSVSDTHTVTNCDYTIDFGSIGTSDCLEITLSQHSDTHTFSGSGTLIFIADFYPYAHPADGLADVEAITEFKGDITEYIRDYDRFPDAQFTHNITML